MPVKSAEIAESRANILPKLWRFPPAIFWVWVGTGSSLTVGLCRPWWKKRQGKYSLVSGLQISRQSPGELALGYVRDSLNPHWRQPQGWIRGGLWSSLFTAQNTRYSGWEGLRPLRTHNSNSKGRWIWVSLLQEGKEGASEPLTVVRQHEKGSWPHAVLFFCSHPMWHPHFRCGRNQIRATV